MTYEEAIAFWFQRVNYEQKSPQPDDLKLQHMRTLLHELGDPHEQLCIVHVAGSKGKGSTSALLEATLRAAGYRIGLFTSPHLVRVEERIQVDREPISAAELATLMEEIRHAATTSRLERELTFFEIGTALGFLHLVRRRVDIAVVEVGLGGRFDSTNVATPIVALITSISLDHTQVLGNTPEQIAFEKAGIIKSGRPTISGVRGDGPCRVVAQACCERGSTLRQLDVDFQYVYTPAVIGESRERGGVVDVRTWRNDWKGLSLGLIGAHQAQNAALAVAAVEVLRELGIRVGTIAVRQGLAQVCWPARLEILGRCPLVVLDCAHNVASAHALVEALATSFPLAADARRWLVFAGSRDKDLAGMLAALAPLFDRIVLTRFAGSPRATPPEELQVLLPPDKRASSVIAPTALDAWRLARCEAADHDLICVAGSVFLAGELRPVMMNDLRVAAEPVTV